MEIVLLTAISAGVAQTILNLVLCATGAMAALLIVGALLAAYTGKTI